MKRSIVHNGDKATNIEELQCCSPETSRWNYRNNNELTELLDHLADVLSDEYIRLMSKSGVEEAHK